MFWGWPLFNPKEECSSRFIISCIPFSNTYLWNIKAIMSPRTIFDLKMLRYWPLLNNGGMFFDKSVKILNWKCRSFFKIIIEQESHKVSVRGLYLYRHPCGTRWTLHARRVEGRTKDLLWPCEVCCRYSLIKPNRGRIVWFIFSS